MQKIKKQFWSIISILYLTAFFGFLLETILFLIVYQEYSKRGALHLPLCLIYGFSITIIYLLFDIPQKSFFLKSQKEDKRIIRTINSIILYFIMVVILCFIIEYGTAYVIDKMGREPLWSYENYNDNINGYVSLRILLGFGALGTTYMYFVYPILLKLFNKVRKNYLAIFNVLFTIIVIIDILISNQVI